MINLEIIDADRQMSIETNKRFEIQDIQELTRLQLILVDEAEDGDVVLGADGGGDDGVIVVDDLFKRSHGHRGTYVVIKCEFADSVKQKPN